MKNENFDEIVLDVASLLEEEARRGRGFTRAQLVRLLRSKLNDRDAVEVARAAWRLCYEKGERK